MYKTLVREEKTYFNQVQYKCNSGWKETSQRKRKTGYTLKITSRKQKTIEKTTFRSSIQWKYFITTTIALIFIHFSCNMTWLDFFQRGVKQLKNRWWVNDFRDGWFSYVSGGHRGGVGGEPILRRLRSQGDACG